MLAQNLPDAYLLNSIQVYKERNYSYGTKILINFIDVS